MDRVFQIGTLFGLSIREASTAGWTALAVECAPCGTTTHISLWRLQQISRYGFFQEVVDRMHCHMCKAQPTAAYMVQEVKRVDPMKGLSHRVELWSDGAVRFYETRAACSSVVTAHAAFDAEHEAAPRSTLLLRQGTYVIRSTLSDPPPGNVVPIIPREVKEALPEVRRRKRG